MAAARQVLANSVAGIMLAVTQPLRVGDWVTFEENYGVVEDVRLNFTILRTAGLGPGRALSLLGVVGLLFAVLTFSLGEYVTPHSEQAAGFLKARFGMGLAIGRTGAWLKERRTDPDGERSITVNVIAPGFIETDMTSELTEELKAIILKQIPMGKFGSADDIADAALFLASSSARYITGQVLTVDGGMVM